MKRNIESAQTHPRLISVTLTTTGTPAVSGSDKYQISSVVDNGTGDVTIIFRRPFAKIPEVVLTSQGSTLQHSQVKAKDTDRVTVNIFSNANVAADGIVDVMIFGTDDRFYR